MPSLEERQREMRARQIAAQNQLSMRRARGSENRSRPQLPPNEHEEYLTPKEVANILRVSPEHVLRRFGNYPSVIVLGTRTPARGKRPRRVLRIPRDVLNRFLHEHRNK